jgi:hypothetical protein
LYDAQNPVIDRGGLQGKANEEVPRFRQALRDDDELNRDVSFSLFPSDHQTKKGTALVSAVPF